jgi:hypothetical protein
VAEWQFNVAEDLLGSAKVKLDTAAPAASGESIIMEQSAVLKEPTGLGDKWKPFLRDGYLDVGEGGGLATPNLNGLVTGKEPANAETNYSAYMGFSGLGRGTWDDGQLKGGTVYLVVSPKGAWGSNSRFALMGTGHQIEGAVTLQFNEGPLSLTVGGSAAGRVTAKLEQDWEPGKWYFIAATWREGAEPVIYVREMDPAGPKTSPAAVTGKADEQAPAATQPEFDPLVIGAGWSDYGNGAFTVDGASARIAYARLDNISSSPEEIEEVFKGLAKP